MEKDLSQVEIETNQDLNQNISVNIIMEMNAIFYDKLACIVKDCKNYKS